MSVLTLPPSHPPAPSPYPTPQPGASLLLAFHPQSRPVLIIGSNKLASARAFTALEAGARVVVLCESGAVVHPELKWREERGEVEILSPPDLEEGGLEKVIREVGEVMLVCITDTLVSSTPTPVEAQPRSLASATALAQTCRRHNIPVNVADLPHLCDFTFPSTHRFPLSRAGAHFSESSQEDVGGKSSLQLAITANGQGCRLASRIRRHVVRSLPGDVGDAVENVGKLRRMARTLDASFSAGEEEGGEGDEDAAYPLVPINTPVAQLSTSPLSSSKRERTEVEVEEEVRERQRRRMRWVAQVSEYWSFEKLAGMGEGEMREVLRTRGELEVDVKGQSGRCVRRVAASGGAEDHPSKNTAGSAQNMGIAQQTTPSLGEQIDPLGDRSSNTKADPTTESHHSLHLSATPPPLKQGRILLVGSGPGHPSLLTLAAHRALTSLATLILSDKLVPPEILALIPPSTPLHIAKKFPGNAEGAQSELIDLAIEGAKRGETVVRLKQGDPFLYGRGGEELLAFRAAGFPPLIIPGISSALAGPLLADIPVTQRGVAESVAIYTGVGRGGREVSLPEYERSRTLVLLMGVARLRKLVERLTGSLLGYPKGLPVAIIERASSPDQRVLLSTLEWVVDAVEQAGEARVPGMLCIGWACSSMSGQEGELGVLSDGVRDEERERTDGERVERWLGGRRWRVEEGLSERWEWVEDAVRGIQ